MLKNVLSLFDGIACGKLALDRAGVRYGTYYASEIDEYAIAVARYNHPDIVHVGDIRHLNGSELSDIDLLMGGSPCQNLSIAGKKQGMATKTKVYVTSLEQYLELKEQGFEFEGESYLFWEFVRLLKELKPKWFLLENVRMAKKWRDVITNALEVEPVEINSALVSAQNRVRLYWTNIPIRGLPEDKGILLIDILEDEVDEKYYIKRPFRYLPENPSFIIDPYNRRNVYSGKATALRTNYANGNCWINESCSCRQVAELCGFERYEYVKRIYSTHGKSPALTSMQGGYRQPKILVDRDKSYCIDACYYRGSNLKEYFKRKKRQLVFHLDKSEVRVRRLTPLECERLQTLPDDYTKNGLFDDGEVRQLSDARRYKLVGNAWTVDVIAWILSFVKHPRQHNCTGFRPVQLGLPLWTYKHGMGRTAE